MIDLAFKIIKAEEGFRKEPYFCTEGVPTIGFGRVVGKKVDKVLPNISTTVEAETPWTMNRISEITKQLSQRFPLAWSKCNEVRKAVLISCAYQLGVAGLSAFRKMWKAIETEDWKEASIQMLDSLAARQTPNRWIRQSEMFRTGIINNYYK